jgi:hypothetical protein
MKIPEVTGAGIVSTLEVEALYWERVSFNFLVQKLK